MDACTIIAKNYLAHARVLAESWVREHPGTRFHVLVIDDTEGWIDAAGEPFELVTPAELDIERFDRMAVAYDVLELATAVKPWLLRVMLERSGGRGTMYLDPDMRLYAPLDDVFDLVEHHGLVLSPHNLGPMPRDGKRPNEQDILIAGAYNLGFIGIGSGAFADELLDWWGERLESDCIVDPERGFFVDQRWIDLVPGMAESFHLLRDPGFNVAYWNLPSRPVSERDGRWTVGDGVPLRLFHYSGFDHRRPHVLSKHQDRIRLADHPDLARLCAGYADELGAKGVDEASSWPYTYAATASGHPLGKELRRLHRDLAVEGFAPSLFDPEGERAFFEALNQPAALGGEQGVTRYLQTLWERRTDLQTAYPDIAGADAEGFLGWAHVYGTVEVPIPEPLLPRRPAHIEPGGPPPGPAPVRAPLGVNVAGYLRSEMGVGEVARQAIAALDTHRVPAVPVGLPAPLSRQGHAFADVSAPARGFPVNLVCVNADMLPAFARDAGPGFFSGRHTIGWWWWEVAEFPEHLAGAFEHVDEVWAGSRFVADAIEAVAPVPVLRVPTPVAVAPVMPSGRADLGFPEGFLFLFMFDFHSVPARKNPLGLVDAFLRAFPEPGAGASLVLKTINAEHHPDAADRIRAAIAGHAHVRLVDRYVAAADRTRMLQSCDGYVSLHRSEGFGITMAEAMLLGKPVVATGYSGNLDFMTAENSFLVGHELARVGDDAGPYPADAQWAEPDLDHAAEQLRRVVEDPEEAAERARRGREDVDREHSPWASGAAMARRLRIVHGRMPVLAERDRAREAEEQAAAAGHLLGVGPQAPGGRRLGRVRRLPRRAALRLMRPYTAHQQRIDRELSSGLREAAIALEESLRRAEEDAHRDLVVEAGVLAELRRLDGRLSSLEQAGNPSSEARIDDLARQADALRGRVDTHAGLLGGLEAEPLGDDAAGLAGYPQAPAEPWSVEYNTAHAQFVTRELGDDGLLERFRGGTALPDTFGRGFDERVVEFPWVLGQELGGRVLDAGSALNHLHVLRRVRPEVDELHIVTLVPEERAFPRLGVSYLFADLRELPLQDATYDRVVSISTLEHVGMENTHYGSDVSVASDPQREAVRAAREMRRIVRAGGRVHLTVPVGRGERFSWVRTFTPDELDELVEAFAPADATREFFRHDAGGWQRATADEVADARYRDHFSSGPVRDDGVVAAEAVGCVTLTVGS